jgi:hypothetical protein
MIEEALHRQLQPVADRRRHLYLARRLSLYWLMAGLAGLGLLGVHWLWGYRPPLAATILCVATILITIWVALRSRRLQPDYRAIARDIEQHHPDLRALLLTAVEQEPRDPDGQWGYLQTQVLNEAVAHAMGHDWRRSISTRTLVLARLGRMAAFVFLLAVLAQTLPSSPLLRHREGILAARGYHVTISPGDTTVERGSPVVIVARFEGRLPSSATLLFGPADREPQRLTLTKSLDDPVFGGIVQDLDSELLYHVEYANRRTRDYTIRVYQSPELVRADARIVYPSYTKLPERVIKDTRQIGVVEGSEITLTFTLNKPVTTARLVPVSGIALGLTVDSNDPNVLTTSLTASQGQRYELRMADAQGHTNKMPPRFVIDVFKNLPPEVTPVFPNNDVAVSPLEELALEAEVADDFGLTGYGLTYTLAGTASRDIPLGSAEAPDKKPQIQYLLALEDLQARPDQLLTYYFWADDIGPDGQTRRTASDIYFAEVRRFEEIFRENQSFQDRQNQDQQENQGGDQQNPRGEQLARLQKQIISATWNLKQQADRSGGIGDRREDANVIRQSQAEVLQQARTARTQAEDPSAREALQAAAGHMETSLDHLTKASESAAATELTPALGAEQSAYQELLKLRDREFQVAQGRRGTGRNSGSSARLQQQLQQLQLTQQENRYETQRLAQSREQTAQREDLQVLNRLRELARRQNEMSDKLREAEAALRQARNEQQRQEALRELKRLRDEQLQAVRDVDELQQRMENAQNRRRMADARDRLEDSRSQIQRSAEALEQGMVSRAATSATRAQRQLEQMRDEFQRRTSSQFSEEMRNMRDEARGLDERQRQIAEDMNRQVESNQKTLADSNDNRELADRVDRQKESLEKLLEQMKSVSDQAEPSEPLLSRRLYDTLRKASTEDVNRALDITSDLLRRSLAPQARLIEQQAGRGIEDLRRGVEEAARSVLGDEAESLRLARQQLDELIRQVNEQASRAAGGARPQPGDPNGAVASAANEPRQADSQGRNRDGQQDRQSADRPPGSAQSDRSQQAREGGTPRDGARPQDAENRGGRGRPDEARADAGGRADPTGGGGNRPAQEWEDLGTRGSFTSADYRQWSDRLREVEEMLPEQELRDEAVRVRERTRALWADAKRHGNEPQWDLLREQVMDPLTELRQRVSEKLARLELDKPLVPIDRDPVPERFADTVRTYFENLGQDNP